MSYKSIKKKHIAITTIIIVVIALVFIFSGSDDNVRAVNSEIQHVPDVSSEEAIHLDVTEDPQGRIHLVWQSKEEGVQYQVSEDSGENWTDPVLIADTAEETIRHRPQIFYHGGVISIFWWDKNIKMVTSRDAGQTWSQPLPVLFQISPTFLAPYELAADGETMYAAYFTKEGLFLSQSRDIGQTWTTPTKISGIEGWRTRMEGPALSLDGQDVYLLWEAEDEQLLWASSNDQGTTWSKPKKVDIRGRSRYSEIYNTNDYAILYPTIAASQVGALALYEVGADKTASNQQF